MPARRKRAIGACLLALLLAGAEAPPPPTRVTYLLGGLLSGPYRLSADLEARTLVEAATPRGARGDAARLRAADLPDTARHPLAPPEAERIGRLAAAVLDRGAARPGCPPMADALMSLIITAGAAERRFDLPVPCLTPEARQLVDRLLCTAHPGSTGCR
ncbi:hypothetical protein [Roseomonas sp. BN140053]|uniref:hypothetical protein n=1 Tax=Roseomonas sp. BN140053 TaxID=3391898 RepID=UPI0039ECD2B6